MCYTFTYHKQNNTWMHHKVTRLRQREGKPKNESNIGFGIITSQILGYTIPFDCLSKVKNQPKIPPHYDINIFYYYSKWGILISLQILFNFGSAVVNTSPTSWVGISTTFKILNWTSQKQPQSKGIDVRLMSNFLWRPITCSLSLTVHKESIQVNH